MGLLLDIDSSAARPVLLVHGEIDLATASSVSEGLHQLIEGGNATVIVNLDGVDFLDSTGLGALVTARAAAVEAGGTLPLVSTSARIRKLFVITGLEDLFDFYDSVDAARAAVG